MRGYTGKSTLWDIPSALEVRVVTEDREGPSVEAAVLINPADDEILISDALAGALGLILLDTERGIWRFRDDPPNRERPSEAPSSWEPEGPE